MTPTSPSAEAGRLLPVVRLGPSAAGRCRRRVHLDAAEATPRAAPSAARQRALDELAEHRAAVVSAIAELHPSSGSSAAWRTDPTPIVLAPGMTTAHRSGSADLLLWSHDGYQPVIIRAHRTREAGAGAQVSTLLEPQAVHPDPATRARRNRADRLALAHHYRQLTDLGCASSQARGGVIGKGPAADSPPGARDADDGAVIVWHELGTGVPPAAGSGALGDYDRRFADRLAVAQTAVAGGPPLAWPSRIAECKRCQWWPRCSAELLAAQDISLLLVGGDVERARAAGVDTIADLAEFPRPELAALALTTTSAPLARVRARAWLRGESLVRISARSDVRRADVEVDVDAESYGDDGPYLWGAQLSGAAIGLPSGFRAFVTWEQLPDVSQGLVFGEFFRYLEQVIAAATDRGLTVAVHCFGRAAEERWMLGLARRFEGLPGVPDAATITLFCASPVWVDLLQEIRREFVATGSLRLKDLAGRIGFQWRDPEPGGENSMAWYRAVVEESPSLRPGHPMAGRILQYNEDDVLATLAVRSWITAHRLDLPTVAELEAPDWRRSTGAPIEPPRS